MEHRTDIGIASVVSLQKEGLEGGAPLQDLLQDKKEEMDILGPHPPMAQPVQGDLLPFGIKVCDKIEWASSHDLKDFFNRSMDRLDVPEGQECTDQGDDLLIPRVAVAMDEKDRIVGKKFSVEALGKVLKKWCDRFFRVGSY